MVWASLGALAPAAPSPPDFARPVIGTCQPPFLPGPTALGKGVAETWPDPAPIPSGNCLTVP